MSGIVSLDPIDFSEVMAIADYLKTYPIQNTRYRTNVSPLCRSQTFGIVQRRSLHPDISRNTWKHPYLFRLLCEFAKKHVPVPFTSVQVNDSVVCAKHKDKGNTGLSYIVAFSKSAEDTFTGGDLSITEGAKENKYNINLRPLLFDGSSLLHGTEPFEGTRYSIVFHTIKPKDAFASFMPSLSSYEAFHDSSGKWKIRDIRNGNVYWGSHGLPHPLKNRKKTIQENPGNPK